MAFTASAVMEMRSTGSSNLNSGVFDSGVASPGVDRTQQDASHANGTDLASSDATGATPTVTSAGYTFVADDVGNSICISSGTNWTVSIYIIISVSGGAATLDKACGSAASITNGTWRMGGAYPGGNATAGISDDARMELLQPGNKVWVKAGTYTLNEFSLGTTPGTATDAISMVGYNSTRGDDPTGDNRPLFTMGANRMLFTNGWIFRNARVTGTGTVNVQLGSSGQGSLGVNLKSVNTSTTANRNAYTLSFQHRLINSEGVSYRGEAVEIGSGSRAAIVGCWFHSSNIGIRTTNASVYAFNNIISDVVAQGLLMDSGGETILVNNTFVGGASTQRGVGIDLATPASTLIMNNTISGFVTGINKTSEGSNPILWADYNNFYNNGTNVTNVTNGANTITLNPTFSDLTEVNNVGTVTAGAADNIITDSGQNFTTAGVVAGRDYFYLVSGTNCTAGMYGITSVGTTTVTLDLDPTSSSTGSNIVYRIVRGQDFKVGTNLKAVGFPGAFQGGYTTAYIDIGGVQRQEQTGGSGGFFIQ